MNNKGADQTVRMRRLICTFVVRIWLKQVFTWRGSYGVTKNKRKLLSFKNPCWSGNFVMSCDKINNLSFFSGWWGMTLQDYFTSFEQSQPNKGGGGAKARDVRGNHLAVRKQNVAFSHFICVGLNPWGNGWLGLQWNRLGYLMII